MIVQKERELTKEEENIVNCVLEDFENSLKNYEPDSKEALALAIFINSCVDRATFQHNKFSALVYYSKARTSALILEGLLQRKDGVILFNQGVRCAQAVLRNSLLLNVDFFSYS